MKKQYVLASAAVMMLSLSGCKDAVANISTGDETLFKVGDITVTNQDIYRPLLANYGYEIVNTEVEKAIFAKEVEITDEINKAVQAQLAEVKEEKGDSFASYLKDNGYADEKDYADRVLLPAEQMKALTKKFLTENASEQIETYKPVKVRIIACTSEENANKALEAVKNGTSFEEAAKQYGKTDTYTGAEEVVNQDSELPSSVWAKISPVTDKEKLFEEVIEDTASDPNSGDNSASAITTYYVVKITNTNALDEFQEEAIQSIMDDSATAESDAMVYYLEKHNFQVYDIDIYTMYQSSNPTYLVQDEGKNEDDSTSLS